MTSTPAAVARAIQLLVVPRSIPQAVVFIRTSSREDTLIVGMDRSRDNDPGSQKRSVGAQIALFENPMDQSIPLAVGGRIADDFGNADANALGFRPVHRSRLPAGSVQEHAFRALHELAGRPRQLHDPSRAIELVE